MRTRDCRCLRQRFHFLAAFFATALFFLGWSSLNAHVIIMKDGFTLKGTIKEEKEILAEGGFIGLVGKLNGFKMVDDGPRRMVFSHKQVQDVVDKDVDQGGPTLRFTRPTTAIPTSLRPPGHYTTSPPGNPNGNPKALTKTP